MYESLSLTKERGPHHGMRIHTPYLTKDHLQLKRFTAQQMGTTYVYDFPEMFNQVLKNEWESCKKNSESESENILDDSYVVATELALDAEKKNLESVNRNPGVNDVNYYE